MNKLFENEVFEDEELDNGIPVQAAAKSVSSDAKGAQDSRHEESTKAETGEVLEEPAKTAVRLVKAPGTRVKRTEQQMLAALGGSALKKATYAAERISKLEDKITELMGAIGPEARQLILNDFPHLSRY